MKVILPFLLLAIGLSFLILKCQKKGERWWEQGENTVSEGNEGGASRLSSRQIPTQPQAFRSWESRLIKQGLVAGVETSYHEFIMQMNLDSREHDYFCSLLTKRTLEQGTRDLQWAQARHGNLAASMENPGTTLSANSALIRQFLNNDEDFEAFLRFENCEPERHALSQVGAAMALTAEEEASITESLYQCRREVENETGISFESWRFLAEFKDLNLLNKLRDATDQKILHQLPKLLPPGQARTFEDRWKTFRDIQEQQARLTLELIEKEQSQVTTLPPPGRRPKP